MSIITSRMSKDVSANARIRSGSIAASRRTSKARWEFVRLAIVEEDASKSANKAREFAPKCSCE